MSALVITIQNDSHRPQWVLTRRSLKNFVCLSLNGCYVKLNIAAPVRRTQLCEVRRWSLAEKRSFIGL